MPDLKDHTGHVFDYHIALMRALKENGVAQAAWAPKICSLTLPERWKKILNSSESNSHLQKITFYFDRVSIFHSALKNTPDLKNTVLFLEHFRISDLLELFSALLWIKNPPEVWLLHRYSPNQMRCKGKIHRLLYQLLRLKIGEKKLKFFTDSEILASQQEVLFQRPVAILPIPHGQTTNHHPFERSPDLIYCWWPGGATRESKGLKHIARLSEILAKRPSSIRLIVAKNALAKGVVASPSLIAIEDDLNRETYERWMQTIDIALLPYSPDVYHSGTSGIFVEAVSAGKTPLIHAGTWMEYEAKKHRLEEIVIQWDNPNLLEQIESIHRNPNVIQKINSMKRTYSEYHSERGLATALIPFIRHS